MDDQIPDELLKAYRSSIPEKLAQLKQLILAVKRQTGKDELGALRFAVHKLAGNSGVYGYMEVSKLCKQIEAELDTILQNLPGTAPDPKWLEKLDPFYQQIEKGFSHGG